MYTNSLVEVLGCFEFENLKKNLIRRFIDLL